MKNCGRHNVRKYREIKGNDKYVTLDISLKFDSLHVIPLLLVLSAKNFHNFWSVVMALAPHSSKLALTQLPTYWTLRIAPIISLSQQWLIPNETQPGLTSQNVRGLEESLPPVTIPGAAPCISWVFCVGIYCPFISDWIESTQAQILFPRQMQNGDTETNSKYCLKEYFNIA